MARRHEATARDPVDESSDDVEANVVRNDPEKVVPSYGHAGYAPGAEGDERLGAGLQGRGRILL